VYARKWIPGYGSQGEYRPVYDWSSALNERETAENEMYSMSKQVWNRPLIRYIQKTEDRGSRKHTTQSSSLVDSKPNADFCSPWCRVLCHLESVFNPQVFGALSGISVDSFVFSPLILSSVLSPSAL
jgi:hypothetical protein